MCYILVLNAVLALTFTEGLVASQWEAMGCASAVGVAAIGSTGGRLPQSLLSDP